MHTQIHAVDCHNYSISTPFSTQQAAYITFALSKWPLKWVVVCVAYKLGFGLRDD